MSLRFLLVDKAFQLGCAAVALAIESIVALVERISPVGLVTVRIEVACLFKVGYRLWASPSRLAAFALMQAPM